MGTRPAFLLRSLLVLVVCWLSSPTARAGDGLKVYYLRHAEAGHNVLSQWKDKPKSEWPPYVGNPNMFTPAGEKAAAGMADKLRRYAFDFVAVSPEWRTKATVRPYLEAVQAKAELWPELDETGGPSFRLLGARDLPPPSPDLYTGGREIKLDVGEGALFTIRADAKVLCKIAKPREPAATEPQTQPAADMKDMALHTVKMLRERFGGKKNTSVLLVGHAITGQNLIKVLTNDYAFGRGLLNGKLWMAEEQADGSFRLVLLNDEPYVSPATRPATATAPAR